ncbi:transketolase [Candidatus Fermentibacterales bacterium]|nr:transketolase [Candidatus Fermentibacterales bacterium]
MTQIRRTLFEPAALPADVRDGLRSLCAQARGDILTMTTLAGCGHPGGSMSSLEILSLLYSQARLDPSRPTASGRDRVIVSNGHISPGVYSVLGRLGFLDLEEALVSFRLAGSEFEGHVERSVPGLEITTGNLGQGLSAACGFAVADRSLGLDNHVWVVTGDGEQQKGQNCEARRFAARYGLDNLTVIVDCNGLQISGSTSSIMPVDLEREYLSSGWRVEKVDEGHDLEALYRAIRGGSGPGPTLVIARTVMGKGVSFMENVADYHGKALTPDQLASALGELGLENRLDELRERRRSWKPMPPADGRGSQPPSQILEHYGEARIYPADHKGDDRGAFGSALLDLARSNPGREPLVFDCDLAGSVRTSDFGERYPGLFFQCGVQEHHAVSAAGAASLTGRVVFFAGFGVFAIDETFNQHRLNDINMTGLKVVATHCGLDVGEDGKTHHCINYLGLLRTLRHYSTIVPADPNQTDRVIRHIATHPGNYFVAMGRSKTRVIQDEEGQPFYGESYRFSYGQADLLRTGRDVAVLTMGLMCQRAIEVRDALSERGISAAVFNISCPLSIGTELVDRLRDFRLVATYEDHDRGSGLGASLSVAMAEAVTGVPLARYGVREYGFSGPPEELYRMQGLLPEQVARALAERLKAL